MRARAGNAKLRYGEILVTSHSTPSVTFITLKHEASIMICADVESLAILTYSSVIHGIWSDGQVTALALDLDRGSGRAALVVRLLFLAFACLADRRTS